MTFDQLARHAGHKIECWTEKVKSVSPDLVCMEDTSVQEDACQAIVWCKTCETTVTIVEKSKQHECGCGDCRMDRLGSLPRSKFVLLQGEAGNKFFCLNGDDDPTKSADGATIYKIVGYADTVEEAQIKLYGEAVPR